MASASRSKPFCVPSQREYLNRPRVMGRGYARRGRSRGPRVGRHQPMRRALALLLLLPLALVACGNDSKADPVEVVSGSGAATNEAGTARMALTTAVQDVAVKADGLIDFENQRGQLTTTAAGQDVHVAFDGGTVYLQVPPAAAAVFGVTTPWASIDYGKLGQDVTGTDVSQLTGGATNPAQGLSLLGAGLKNVKEVGTDD